MDSVKIGIPKNEGIIEVKELLLLIYVIRIPQVIKKIPKISEKFIAVNGDTFSSLDYQKFYQDMKQNEFLFDLLQSM